MLRIADATHNTYILGFLRYLGPFIIPGIAIRKMEETELTIYQEGLRDEHRAIVNAIVAGQASLAGDAMRHHLMHGLKLNKAID
jgi:GntR family transcriptional repressor for pyruvate dehydrogenase complex